MAREGGVIAWQWGTYARFHRDRVNLVLHFLSVPAFIAGAIAAVQLSLRGAWMASGIALACVLVAFALQAVGHKREAEAPIPFEDGFDFASRILAEQFVTFPRFVLSGGWFRHMIRDQSSNRGPYG